MAQVNATIAGRQFRLACEDGQEEHLQALAKDVDARIIELRRKFGEIGDTRLTVMAALTVADELVEAGRQDPPAGGGNRSAAGRARGVLRPRQCRPRRRWSMPSTRRPSASKASPASSTRRWATAWRSGSALDGFLRHRTAHSQRLRPPAPDGDDRRLAHFGARRRGPDRAAVLGCAHPAARLYSRGRGDDHCRHRLRLCRA